MIRFVEENEGKRASEKECTRIEKKYGNYVAEDADNAQVNRLFSSIAKICGFDTNG
jgi:hypothetical protein